MNVQKIFHLTHFKLSFVGIALGLLLCEGAIRCLGVAPRVAFLSERGYRLSRNPSLGYEPVPHSQYLTDLLNDIGMRDVTHPIKKLPGVKRLAVLGDSISMGLGIANRENIYPVVLKKSLVKHDPAIEVINFSASGYNTMQEVSFLSEYGVRYQPDLVLLQYCMNDTLRHDGQIFENLLALEKGEHGLSQQRISRWLGWSHLYRLLRFRLFPVEDDTKSLDQSFVALGQNTVIDAFSRLHSLAQQHHFEVVVAIFPYLDQLSDYRSFSEHSWVTKAASEKGFKVIDLLPLFIECEKSENQRIFLDSLHPNEIGHRCIGRKMGDELVARALLKPRYDR